jgi:prolyl-tRNA editing enzyme YbaK/EbsC (Cys-tRNA(Pro) deacylase)
MSQERIAAYLREQGIEPRFRRFDDTHSSQLAAEAVGVELGQIAKTICFVAGGDPVLVVAPGDRRVDVKRLRDYLGTKPRLADADTVLAVTGYEPGAITPVALATPVRLLLDRSLRRFNTFWCGGGSRDTIMEISLAHLERLTGGAWVDLCEGAS